MAKERTRELLFPIKGKATRNLALALGSFALIWVVPRAQLKLAVAVFLRTAPRNEGQEKLGGEPMNDEDEQTYRMFSSF